MKNLFYYVLPVLLLVIASCSDKAVVEEDNIEYQFQKDLTIQDNNGNSADITVFTNSKEDLDQHTVDVFTLSTFTEKELSLSINVEDVQNIEEIEESVEDEIFVLIRNYNLSPEISGFNVISKLDANSSSDIQKRYTTTLKYYSYGSEGTKGARVYYYEQSCADEYIKIKLSKKNSSSSIFWNTLTYGTLNSPGYMWTYSGSTCYYKFKLRLRIKDRCSNSTVYDHVWLT